MEAEARPPATGIGMSTSEKALISWGLPSSSSVKSSFVRSPMKLPDLEGDRRRSLPGGEPGRHEGRDCPESDETCEGEGDTGAHGADSGKENRGETR
jgi:hypothetical protein